MLVDFSRLEPPLLLLIAEGNVLETVSDAALLPYFGGVKTLALPQLLRRFLLLFYYIIWLIDFIV